MSYVIHIDHRDGDRIERVVGPFAAEVEASSALDGSETWERDTRREYNDLLATFVPTQTVWHHVDDWPYTAVVVEMEPVTALGDSGPRNV